MARSFCFFRDEVSLRCPLLLLFHSALACRIRLLHIVLLFTVSDFTDNQSTKAWLSILVIYYITFITLVLFREDIAAILMGRIK